MTVPYLVANKPRQTQFRDRRSKVTGLIVVHTAESPPDVTGPDDGSANVARFIQGRSDYGSYHVLGDSDSRIQLVAFDKAAYGDGTGSNEFAIHVSAATQAARWPGLPAEWRRGCVRQMALGAADAARWLKSAHGITVPARRVSLAQSNQGAAGFISHGERDPGRRSDPGAAFPWELFLAEFRAATAPTEPPKVRPSRGEAIDAALADLSDAIDNVEDATGPAPRQAKIDEALADLKSGRRTLRSIALVNEDQVTKGK